MRLWSNLRGQVDVRGLVITIVALILSVLIGVVIIGQIEVVAAGMNLGTKANETFTQITNVTWGALPLLAILPLIMIAGVLIGYFAFGRR